MLTQLGELVSEGLANIKGQHYAWYLVCKLIQSRGARK